MRKVSGKLKREDGQSAVEFALVFPILILLVLGMIEFGWILNAKITLTSAAREGARITAVNGSYGKDKAYEAILNTISGTSGLSVSLNDVTYELQTNAIADIKNVYITVIGTVDPIIGLFVNDPVEIKAQAKMRLE